MAAAPASLEKLTGIPVTVAGQTVRIGRLSIDQWVAIAELALNARHNVTVEEAQAAAAKASSKELDISFLLRLFNADTIAQLYSVVTGVDAATLRENFSMAEFLGVISALRDNGELPEVAQAFTKVVSGWGPLSAPSTQSSASSASTPRTATGSSAATAPAGSKSA